MVKKETAAEKAARDEMDERAQHMRQMATEGGGEGGKAALFRMVWDDNKKRDIKKFLGSVPTEAIWNEPHDYLQEQYGGGLYRVTLKDEDGQFVKGMTDLRYEIDGPPIVAPVETPETRRLDELQKQLDTAVAGGSATSSTDMMRLLLEVTREQLREVRNPPAGAAEASPGAMAVNMVTAIQTAQAPLLAALIERAGAPPPDPMAQMKNMVEMMSMLREMSGEGSRGGWDAIAGKLADPLASLVGQHVTNQANGTAPPSTMGGPAPATPAPDPRMADRPPWYAFLEPYLPQLLQFAAQGRDPITTADFLADGMSDEVLPMVYEQLSKPTFMDELRAQVPEAAHNPEWFASFAARMLEWVVPPEPAGEAVATVVEVGTVASAEATE